MKSNAKTQSDVGLKFDGAELMSQDRSNKFRGNQSGLTPKANYGRGPTKGNMDIEKGREEFGSEGRRAPSHTPDTHAKGAYGMPQVRNPGGTRKWEPKAGQNYNGNPDKINAGRGPRKGNQQ